ncbi:hypothetical protein V5O48_005957 [Marasmius crinis-equi]|uniref:Protein kinase domain-containing protein n=1 Tax=Marasmius crinis-equi TaxID=585013 RepID=A0ABR3FKT7_9AGAR
MATASGMLSIISSATQQSRALTVGFGIGAGFCSLVAGSIGLYEQFSKQGPDLERGRDPIEPKQPSAIGSIDDAGASVTTGLEQRRDLRSRHPQKISSFEDLRAALSGPQEPSMLEFIEAWSPSLVADWIYKESESSRSNYFVQRCRRSLDLIAKNFHEFPSSLFMNEIKPLSYYPIVGGRFADIYQGVELTKKQTSESMDVVPILSLKVLRLHVGKDEEEDEAERNKIILNFCREAIVWTRLDHPNIHPFLGVNKKHFAPAFCIITPWMENGSINEFLRKNPSHDKLRAVREIAAGLDYLHSLLPKIVHGDVKGDNVLVAPDYTCRLIDFGLARIVHESTLMEVESSTFHGKGTTRWMAPETLLDSQDKLGDNTPRDIYAYACTVLEIATGKVPFPELNEPQFLAQTVTQGLRPTMPEVPWCPDDVRSLIEQCWETDPSKRPTARDIFLFLGEFSSGEKQLANGLSDGQEGLAFNSSAPTHPLTSPDMSVSSNTSQTHNEAGSVDLSETEPCNPAETDQDIADQSLEDGSGCSQ